MSVKKCAKCFVEFECTNEQRGCWCEGLQIAPENLQKLRENYDNCLCPQCLKEYAAEEIKKSCHIPEK